MRGPRNWEELSLLQDNVCIQPRKLTSYSKLCLKVLENGDSIHIFSYVWETSRKPGKFVSLSTSYVLVQILQVLNNLQLFYFCFAYL